MRHKPRWTTCSSCLGRTLVWVSLLTRLCFSHFKGLQKSLVCLSGRVWFPDVSVHSSGSSLPLLVQVSSIAAFHPGCWIAATGTFDFGVGSSACCSVYVRPLWPAGWKNQSINALVSVWEQLHSVQSCKKKKKKKIARFAATCQFVADLIIFYSF